ncbi:hypothetical protein [Marinobacter halodurans]|uniref:hypothetical protein n=1 Tax=Marinobacter halodurans TaxID=2528979 RepID=UPI0013F14BB4|nr:hypothetical protein [Marinobacter halodurans]
MQLLLRKNSFAGNPGAPLDKTEPRDRELLEGLKVAGIALGVALVAGLLSATGRML